MTKVLTDPKYYTAIANAIRAKNGSTTSYKPSGMADAITALTTSGITEHTVTLKQTKNQTISVAAELSDGTGTSNLSNDITLTPRIYNLLLSVTPYQNYTAGNLIINGKTQTVGNIRVPFDKDYVISAEDAVSRLPAEYAYRLGGAFDKGVLSVFSPTLPNGTEGVQLSQDGTKYMAASVSTAALTVLKKLTPYATTNGSTWTTDVIVDTTNGYSFTLPSSVVPMVIWAASEADRDVIYQKAFN